MQITSCLVLLPSPAAAPKRTQALRQQCSSTKPLPCPASHCLPAPQVSTKDGAVFVARSVICTLPLGVLKSGSVQFSPLLPKNKTEAISKLGVGLQDKIVLAFDKKFWTDTVYFDRWVVWGSCRGPFWDMGLPWGLLLLGLPWLAISKPDSSRALDSAAALTCRQVHGRLWNHMGAPVPV
jgi:hypothetical protein